MEIAPGLSIRLWAASVGGLVCLCLLGSLIGCASEPQQSSSSPELRRSSDRFFEKMKEEERARGTGTEKRVP
jgi:hypothetical protein